MTTGTITAADILKFQNDCARTGQFMPLGRMQKISIGPNAAWAPRNDDPILQRVGRFIELRDQPLPLAQTIDRSLLIVPAPLLHRVTGRVELPDLPDPNWTPGQPTKEEIEGVEVEEEIKDATGQVLGRRKIRKFPAVDNSRRIAPMIKQSLEARAEGLLEGTNFLIFSPVISITFQPEIEKRLIGDAWVIKCSHDAATRTEMALLIDRATGEVHFYGGKFEVMGNAR
jgi:hypothetical protein